MAKHNWSVLCQHCLVDQRTSNVSLINVIDQIHFSVQGEQIQDFENPGKWVSIPGDGCSVSFFSRSDYDIPEVLKLKVTILAPGGECSPNSVTVELDLKNSTRIRSTVGFKNLPFLVSGDYLILFQLEKESDAWDTVAEIPVELIMGKIET